MRFFAPAPSRKTDNVDQHFGKGVAGHRAVGAALHFEVEKQPAVAGQNRDAPHKTFALESAQRRDFFQSRPVLVLEHHARRVVGDDAPDHAGRHLHGQRQRVVLDDEGNVGADRFHRLRVIGDDLIVGAQRRRRRDHHPGRAALHRGQRQGAHRRETRRRDADDDRQLGARRIQRVAKLSASSASSLPRLAHDAEDRAAVGSGCDIIIHQAVDAALVEPPVGRKRRRSNRKNAAGVDGQHGQSSICGTLRFGRSALQRKSQFT